MINKVQVIVDCPVDRGERSHYGCNICNGKAEIKETIDIEAFARELFETKKFRAEMGSVKHY